MWSNKNEHSTLSVVETYHWQSSTQPHFLQIAPQLTTIMINLVKVESLSAVDLQALSMGLQKCQLYNVCRLIDKSRDRLTAIVL